MFKKEKDSKVMLSAYKDDFLPSIGFNMDDDQDNNDDDVGEPEDMLSQLS